MLFTHQGLCVLRINSDSSLKDAPSCMKTRDSLITSWLSIYTTEQLRRECVWSRSYDVGNLVEWHCISPCGHAATSQPQESFHSKMTRDLKSQDKLWDHQSVVKMLGHIVQSSSWIRDGIAFIGYTFTWQTFGVYRPVYPEHPLEIRWGCYSCNSLKVLNLWRLGA